MCNELATHPGCLPGLHSPTPGKSGYRRQTDRSISTTLDQCVSLPHDWQPRRDRVGELAQAAAPQGVSAHENVRCRPKGREGIVVVTSPVVRGGGLAEVISASQARGALWGFGQTLCSHFIEEGSRICLQSKVMKNSIFFMMCMCVRVCAQVPLRHPAANSTRDGNSRSCQ